MPPTATYDFRRKDIMWTTSDYSPDIAKELPYIELQGYQQTSMGLTMGLRNWWRVLKSDTYPGIYMGDRMGASNYILPFYTDTNRSIGQNWQENQGLMESAGGVKDKAEAVGKLMMPTAGIIVPKSYAGATEYSYDIRFTLINTVSHEGIKKNKKFLEQIVSDNLHQQSGSLGVLPPLLYEAYIPGIRWSPVCVIANLMVVNKGTLNIMPHLGKEFTNYIIPDAWEITLQIRELINESRDLYKKGAISNAAGIDNGIPSDIKVFKG
jgi:hypothetical protein